MSSSGYKSIPLGNSKKGTSSINILEDSERPHIYSTPAVSAPLITWFGLPTIIEFEQPAPEGIAQVEEEFKSIKGGSRLDSNLSRSACSTPTVLYRARQQQQQRRSLSKSLFSGGGASATDTNDHCISAYTFRVRSMAEPSLDDHRLRLRQNLDGTYSHVDSSGVATTMPNGDFGIDDLPNSDTGLLMTSHGENHISISLDTVLNLEEAVSNMENKALPPHTHPSIPIEILQPEHTRTAPPLKLWPLAVLVFYSEFRG